MINRRSGDIGRIIVRHLSKKPKVDFYAKDIETAIAWIIQSRRRRGTRNGGPCPHYHWIELSGYTATPPK